MNHRDALSCTRSESPTHLLLRRAHVSLTEVGSLGGRDTVGPANNSRPDVVNRPLFNCKP